MVAHKDEDALTKFSIDDEDNLVIASWGLNNTVYTYQGENENELSEAEKQNIPAENIYENVNDLNISLYPLPVNYKQYITKYITNYGFLSDLLITTKNVNFCLDIAQMAMNSKMVFNLKEELITYDTTSKSYYTQTKLLYDYIKYEVSGQEENSTEEVRVYETAEKKLINLNGNHINEAYEDYTIDENYTRKEEFKYTVIEETHTEGCTYDLDLSEIDCWYLKYKKEYVQPTSEQKPPSSSNANRDGQFPEEFEIVIDNTSNSTQIQNDGDVQAFIQVKEKQYKENYPEVETIECKVSNLTVKQKVKTDAIVDYVSTMTTYSFGEDEEETDITETRFKNIEYINGQPSYTSVDENGNPEIGFLSIYDGYRKNDIDLFLENDSETKLFEFLESDSKTAGISDTMKYLLYVYDGIDRGVTNLDKTFKVIDIKLITAGGISPLGINLTKEEFIVAVQEYCEAGLLVDLADEFYDICTAPEYNVNPALAFTWAAIESSWGESAPYNNLFGMGIGNGMSSGVKYSSYEDSIEDFCKWVVDAGQPGSASYNSAHNRAQEYATVNENFQGGPENNIYALFSTYSYLGDTHIVDEEKQYESETERYEYYKENGSTWGNGGRIQIYYMYEHFLYDGEYSIRCTHKHGTDPTTLQEQADYAQYTIEIRINQAKEIFGEDIFLGGEGYFQELNDGYRVGIYTSRSGRKYTEWIQTTANDVGKMPMFTPGKVMGNYGCNVYACATLVSSTGIDVHLREVYQTYRSCGDNANVATMNTILNRYGVEGQVCNISGYDSFVSVLSDGRGISTWVGPGYNCLYTKLYHWLVVADIRTSELGSVMGYDVYVLPSGNGKGHGWHPIETIVKNLQEPSFWGYYIDD